jgi:hypothetical protein
VVREWKGMATFDLLGLGWKCKNDGRLKVIDDKQAKATSKPMSRYIQEVDYVEGRRGGLKRTAEVYAVQ